MKIELQKKNNEKENTSRQKEVKRVQIYFFFSFQKPLFQNEIKPQENRKRNNCN